MGGKALAKKPAFVNVGPAGLDAEKVKGGRRQDGGSESAGTAYKIVQKTTV